MAGGTFRLEHILDVVDKVSSKAQFPLADAAALEAMLGGAHAAVVLGAEHHKASEVHQMPADFFPIDSREDLFTKLAFLRSANGDRPEDITTTGGLRTDPPPPGAGSQSRSRPHGVRAGRNAPSATPAPG
jgi:hypothetical protein